jgi:hypothetical protein
MGPIRRSGLCDCGAFDAKNPATPGSTHKSLRLKTASDLINRIRSLHVGV